MKQITPRTLLPIGLLLTIVPYLIMDYLSINMEELGRQTTLEVVLMALRVIGALALLGAMLWSKTLLQSSTGESAAPSPQMPWLRTLPIWSIAGYIAVWLFFSACQKVNTSLIDWPWATYQGITQGQSLFLTFLYTCMYIAIGCRLWYYECNPEYIASIRATEQNERDYTLASYGLGLCLMFEALITPLLYIAPRLTRNPLDLMLILSELSWLGTVAGLGLLILFFWLRNRALTAQEQSGCDSYPAYVPQLTMPRRLALWAFAPMLLWGLLSLFRFMLPYEAYKLIDQLILLFPYSGIGIVLSFYCAHLYEQRPRSEAEETLSLAEPKPRPDYIHTGPYLAIVLLIINALVVFYVQVMMSPIELFADNSPQYILMTVGFLAKGLAFLLLLLRMYHIDFDPSRLERRPASASQAESNSLIYWGIGLVFVVGYILRTMGVESASMKWLLPEGMLSLGALLQWLANGAIAIGYVLICMYYTRRGTEE